MKTNNPPVTKWPMGPLSPTKEAEHYLLPKQDFPKKEKWCAACMPRAAPGEITGYMTCVLRPKSDHSDLHSYGTRC